MENIDRNLLAAVLAVDLLAFASGNFYSWSSTALIKLKSPNREQNPLGRPVTSSEESLIASLLSLGAICGPLLAGACSNSFGRRRTILLFSLPMLTSSLILTFATSTWEFYIARFIAGIGVGGVYTVVPMYVGEISETNSRGFLGGIMGIFNVVGMLLSFITGPFVSLQVFCLLQVVPTGLFLLLWAKLVPESPLYYLIKDDQYSARKSLISLRKHLDEKELELMKDTVNKSVNSETSFFLMFSSKAFRKALILTTFMMGCQQFMGSIAILSYMEDIFASSGSDLSSSTSTIIVAILQVCLVVLSTFLVDQWGRKILLMTSIAICASSLYPLGFYFFMLHHNIDVSHLWFVPILCIVMFFVGFNFGLSTIPWTLVGELFATEKKAVASSISSVTYFGMAFLMSFVFPHLKNLVGFHGVFWFCGTFSVLHFGFIYFFLPETKNKCFQEILELMENGQKCEKSVLAYESDYQ